MVLSSFLQKLLFINEFDMKDGEIDMLGINYIMLDASNLLVLQEIDETKMYERMKKNSKSNMKKIVEHAKVYKNIKIQALENIVNLSKRIGSSDEGVINTIQEIFDVYGLGKLRITDLNNKEKKAVVLLEKSALAHEYLKKHGKTNKRICTLTAGILAGIFSFLFKKNVDCFEKSCMVQGNEFCQFIIE